MRKARGLRGLIIGTDGEQLEALSDGMIRDSGELGKTIYTEIQLTRQDVRHGKADSLEQVWRDSCSKIYDLTDDNAWVEIRTAAAEAGILAETLDMIELRREEFSYEQIGFRYRLSPGAVRSRINRAERRIKKLPEFWLREALYEIGHIDSDWWVNFKDQIRAREFRS